MGVFDVDKKSGRGGRREWVRWKVRVGDVEKKSEWGGKLTWARSEKNVGWIEKESITRAFAHE